MADFNRRVLLFWIALLCGAVLWTLYDRAVLTRLLAHTGKASVIWRQGKTPSGENEILTFSREFFFPEKASSLLLHLYVHPSYVLYLNGERVGGGWGGGHTYSLDSAVKKGKNRIDAVILSPDGFGYFLCGMDVGNFGNNALVSDRSWNLKTAGGPCAVRTIGKSPLPFLPLDSLPVEKSLFPTYAGEKPVAPIAVLRKKDWTIADFGESRFGFLVVYLEHPVWITWGERENDITTELPIRARKFPGFTFWTTPLAHHVRYVGIRSDDLPDLYVLPVTGSYPP